METFRVYVDNQTGKQIEHNELGWFPVDPADQALDNDEEAVPVPWERVEQIQTIRPPD